MRFFCAALTIASALISNAVLAHGPQIQITNVDNKIITREVFLDGPYGSELMSPKSVYVMPIAQAVTGNPATSYWTILPNQHRDTITGLTEFQYGPGLAYGIGHTFATRTPTTSSYHFNVNFMDSLRKWDGISTFGANPGPEEIGAFRSDNPVPADTAFTTDTAPYQGLVFNNISTSYTGESHSSMRFRMLGDGSSSLAEPDDGIYLLKLQITSTQDGTDGINPALAPSDVFSFVLYKGARWDEVSAATNSLGVPANRIQYLGIPEPASALSVLIGLGILLTRRLILRQTRG